MGNCISDYRYCCASILSGQGFGKEILKQVMAFIENHAEKGTYVSLIADYPADQLYKKFGFQSTSQIWWNV